MVLRADPFSRKSGGLQKSQGKSTNLKDAVVILGFRASTKAATNLRFRVFVVCMMLVGVRQFHEEH